MVLSAGGQRLVDSHPSGSPDEPLVVRIIAPVPRTTAAELCLAIDARLAERAACDELVCDCSAVSRADLEVLDLLARLALVARQHGADVLVHGAPAALRALIAFSGLRDVLPCRQPSMRSGNPNSG